MSALLRDVDVLIPNEPEFVALASLTGASCRARPGHVVIAGHTGVRIVDTTGAGDAFVGAFAAGLIKFAGEQEAAARFANAAAALSVTKHGTAPAMPRVPEIARFLRRV